MVTRDLQRARGSTRYLACYRDPEGRIRSASSHSTRRAAERAANRQEQKVPAGAWRDANLGTVSFRDNVETGLAAQQAHRRHHPGTPTVSNLTKHLYPFLGRKPMYQITPSLIQDWVTQPSGAPH